MSTIGSRIALSNIDLALCDQSLEGLAPSCNPQKSITRICSEQHDSIHEVMMAANQHQFAKKTIQLLEDSLKELHPDISERLARARELAVSRCRKS